MVEPGSHARQQANPEEMMTTSEYEKTFVERIYDHGFAEGRIIGRRKVILRLLEVRQLAPSEEQRDQVTSCTDVAQLDIWLDRAIAAATAAEVFAD
jgi:hypothetical protein